MMSLIRCLPVLLACQMGIASGRATNASSLEGAASSTSLPQDASSNSTVPATPQTVALPAFRTDNPLPNGYPWSLMSVDTNYYRDQPRTGVIRAYDFTVSRGVAAPDGYEREVLLVNGVFPGPLIEANWGDTIQVTVRNNISAPAEGVALHWHGFLQTGKPWEDGVPAVTQCPIAPGCDFTYSFEAELYGTSWYHSHYSAQYAGGLFGPMVIHGPSDVAYDVDVGPVMLSDWYHGTYNGLVDELMQPDSSGRLFSDCNLINGQGCVVDDVDGATAGVAAFRFQRGKTHRLRLINAGAEALQRFSIDGHNMTVVANDFVAVEPYETRVVTLGIGQRADVLVKADGTLDAYWMRANISMGCSLATRGDAVAAIYYDDSDGGEGDGGDGGNHGNANATIPLPLPRSMPWDLPDPGTCANDDLALTRPRMRLALPEADRVFSMDVRLFSNATNHTLWAFDGVDYRGNYNSPTLLMSHLGNTSFARQWNVRDTGGARSVRVIVKNYSNAAHPMHLHGFNMYLLHEGDGVDWDGTIVYPDNPARRDVIQLRPNGHLVMQFDASENPGVWPFHCHIAWHVSAGFFAQFVTGADVLARTRPPSVVAETCRQWARWTDTNIPAQIDSGL